MTDTSITLTPSGTIGAITVTASAALFTADDVGRLLAIKTEAGARGAATAYSVGVCMTCSDRGTKRLYRVIDAGTTASALLAGTTPDYDLNMPIDQDLDLLDGSCTLRYLGRGKNVWGWGTITAVADSTHCTVELAPDGTLGQALPSFRWRLGEWGGARGWPRTVGFYQSRTVWGGSFAAPQTVWTSETSDFESMSPCDADGIVLDSNAITATLDDDEVNTIRWLSASARGIVVGTPASPFVLGPASSTNGVLSPSNLVARRQGRRGSDVNVAGLPVENTTLFVQRGGRKVRELSYDFAQDAYQAPDLTILAEHVTGLSVLDMAYQEEPEGILWCVRSDGVLATLTYDREQEVRAWCRQQLGGGGVVESVAVVPSPDGATDDVYVSVLRTIGGATKRWVEVIQAPYVAARDGDAGGFFVDAGLTYDGAPATTLTGLDHLEGQTVAICADGAQRTPQVVVSGSISIGTPAASVVHIGLPYTASITLLPPEAGAAAGTAQGVMKRVDHVTLRLLETRSVSIGRGSALEAVPLRLPGDAMTEAVPLYTGDRRIAPALGWERLGQVTIASSDPLPMTVLAVIEELQANG